MATCPRPPGTPLREPLIGISGACAFGALDRRPRPVGSSFNGAADWISGEVAGGQLRGKPPRSCFKRSR